MHPTIRSILAPYSPANVEEVVRKRVRQGILEEYEFFAEKVRHWELTVRLATSSAMIDTNCESERKAADDCIHDMKDAIFGKRWLELRREFDNEGGDVSRMPFPSCEAA